MLLVHIRKKQGEEKDELKAHICPDPVTSEADSFEIFGSQANTLFFIQRVKNTQTCK